MLDFIEGKTKMSVGDVRGREIEPPVIGFLNTPEKMFPPLWLSSRLQGYMGELQGWLQNLT